MIQTFTNTHSGKDGPHRLAALREQMTKEKVDAFLVPRSDAHQGEEVTPANERLAWLTGFSGSAGFAAVLANTAGIFIDGRYRIQVKNETNPIYAPVDWPETKLSDWLLEHLDQGTTIAFDPWLHTHSEISGLEKQLSLAEIALAPIDNLVDRIWQDQPEEPKSPLVVHPEAFTGEAHATKLKRISEAVAGQNASAAVLTNLDAIAWITNTRGTDLAHMPVAMTNAVLHADGRLDLYIDPDKATSEVVEHLGPSVSVNDPEGFEADLEALSGDILVDPKSAPYAVWEALNRREDGQVIFEDDLTSLPKACKNQVELKGAKAAHIRDGAAMVRFLHWLDNQKAGSLDEIKVVQALEGFRAETDGFATISFDTISGAGPNGAIVHYRVNEDSNRTIGKDDILLVDSGGQYRDGTTDITRTLAMGDTTEVQRHAFTAVLKGMIALSMQRFPEGTHGGQLDAIARSGVWALGLDFAHGTGHGVGSYLSVHEGPQRISGKSDTVLYPGMILSNEPGFYLENEFGIRIENLVFVKDTGERSFSENRIFEFETLTWVPIDRKLIEVDMLSDHELAWLNIYHDTVLQNIGPLVDGLVLDWLKEACAPL